MATNPEDITSPEVTRAVEGAVATVSENVAAQTASTELSDIQGMATTEKNIDEANSPEKAEIEWDEEKEKASSGLKWDQPHPKGHPPNANPYPSAKYPFNHVFESESGHIVEFDDDARTSRILTQHANDSFEEIISTSSGKNEKVVKVEGDSYEIVAGKKNIFINSSGAAKEGVTLTVVGNMRHLVMGDYILEVTGDFTQKIHGNKEVKILGDNLEEIKGASVHKIEQHYANTVSNHELHIVGEDIQLHSARNIVLQSDRNQLHSTRKRMVLESVGSLEVITDGQLDILSSKSAIVIGALDSVSIDGRDVNLGTTGPTLDGLTINVEAGNADTKSIYTGKTTHLHALQTVYVDGKLVHLNQPNPPSIISKSWPATPGGDLEP